MKKFICEVCQKEYERKIWKNRQTSRFCSNLCKNKVVGTWVKGHPIIWNNLSEEEKLKRVQKNYEKNVIRKQGCWEWKGNLARRGYGRLNFPDRNHTKGAHIVSWLLHRGQIPEGMCVLHKCDNRACNKNPLVSAPY